MKKIKVFTNENLKSNKILQNLMELLLTLGIYWILDESGSIKYIAAILLSMIFFFFGRKKEIKADLVICTALPMVTYLAMGCFGAFVSANFFGSTLKIILLWLLPYLVTLALYVCFDKDMEKLVDFQLLASCLVFLKPNPLEIIVALHFETVYAFTFGLFAVYYAYKKRMAMFAVAVAFMYMSDKRIAFLAVAAALIVMGILWVFRNHKKLALFIWTIVSGMIGLYIYVIYSGVLEYFCQGLGVNTNGRVKMYGRLAEWFDREFLWFGKGVGVVEMLLENWSVSDFNNLHNDLLKFYVELGLIGLLFFLVSFGFCFYWAEKKVGKSQMSFLVAIAIYSIILFMTDNVSIYILYLLPMYSMCFAVLSENGLHSAQNLHEG